MIGLQPVAGLADHLDAVRRAQQQHEPGAHQVLVVDDGDPDHRRATGGRVACTRKPRPWAPYVDRPADQTDPLVEPDQPVATGLVPDGARADRGR